MATAKNPVSAKKTPLPEFTIDANGNVRIAVKKKKPLDKFVAQLVREHGKRLDVQETLGTIPVAWSTNKEYVPWTTVVTKLEKDHGVVLTNAGGGLYRARRRQNDPLEDPGVRLLHTNGFYYVLAKNAPLTTVIERWNDITDRKVPAQVHAPGLSVPALDAVAATPEELLAAIVKAANVDAKLDGGIWHLAPKKPPEGQEEVSTTWPLTFVGEETAATKVRSKVYPASGKNEGATKIEADDDTSDMSSAVRIARFLYAASNGKLTTGADRNVVMVRGPRDTVRSARVALAQAIDIPYSQVRVDAWAIQVNTTNLSGPGSPQRRKERAQENLEDIRAGIMISRDLTLRLSNALTAYVRQGSRNMEMVLKREVRKPLPEHAKERPLTMSDVLSSAGFDVNPLRPLTTAESMVFLALRLGTYGDTHEELGDALRMAGLKYLKGVETDLTVLEAGNTSRDADVTRRVARLRKLVASMRAKLDATGHGAFPHFLDAYDDSGAMVVQKGIENFFFNWFACNNPVRCKLYVDEKENDLPILLSQSAAGADAMLKSAMGGFTTDVQSLTVQPLLGWIRSTVQEGDARKSGIDLVGNTSLVVSSRLRAATDGTAQAAYPFLPRPKLGFDDLKADNTDKSLLPTLLKGATPLELQLAMAMFREPTMVYDTVAPGIELSVRPQVLRDGGSARLQIELKSSMSVAPPGSGGTDPLDHVKGHNMTTDVAVQALDLLEVSTFGMNHTGLGDPSWRIPVLEQIPLLGPMFRGPRTRLTKHQESMVILSVTVLPKSLDLAGGYIRQ